ncbi:hypothetical protein HY024_02740 [Candidatus Curtissbacteria bacterium]|nr:hypothetical protein [Candidatus Curtissbacteria bacterium]
MNVLPILLLVFAAGISAKSFFETIKFLRKGHGEKSFSARVFVLFKPKRVTPGHYVITAEKTHYVFPSKIVKGATDGKYANVYHGEVIEVENPYIINLNIPMDPAGFDWNQSIKTGKYHAGIEFFKRHVRFFIIVLGTTTAEFLYIAQPSNVVLLSVGLFLFNLLFIEVETAQKLWGTTYFRITREPAPRMIIKAIRMPYKLTVATTTSDHLGRYFLLLAQGKYTIQVEMPSKDGGKSEVLKKVENIEVKKEKEMVNFDIGI